MRSRAVVLAGQKKHQLLELGRDSRFKVKGPASADDKRKLPLNKTRPRLSSNRAYAKKLSAVLVLCGNCADHQYRALRTRYDKLVASEPGLLGHLRRPAHVVVVERLLVQAATHMPLYVVDERGCVVCEIRSMAAPQLISAIRAKQRLRRSWCAASAGSHFDNDRERRRRTFPINGLYRSTCCGLSHTNCIMTMHFVRQHRRSLISHLDHLSASLGPLILGMLEGTFFEKNNSSIV